MSLNYRLRLFFVLLWDGGSFWPRDWQETWMFTYDVTWCDDEQNGLTARQALAEAYYDMANNVDAWR